MLLGRHAHPENDWTNVTGHQLTAHFLRREGLSPHLALPIQLEQYLPAHQWQDERGQSRGCQGALALSRQLKQNSIKEAPISTLIKQAKTAQAQEISAPLSIADASTR